MRTYLEGANQQIELALESGEMSPKQVLNGTRVITYNKNAQATVDAAIDKALKIFAMDSLPEAQPIADELSLLIEELFNGSDKDDNGMLDPIQDEGGILTAYDFTLLMAEIDIFPDKQ